MMHKRKPVARFLLFLALLFAAFAVCLRPTAIRLTAQNKSYPPKTAVLPCTLKNASLQTVTYGKAFTVEQLVDGRWVKLDELKRGVRFELGIETLLPFSSAALSFPISIYASFDHAGDYRVVYEVRTKTSAYPLFCPFSVR